MEKIIDALLKMPAFLTDLLTDHLIVTAIGIMIFLLALIVPGRIGSFIRKVVILANVLFAMAGGFMGKGQNGYQIICLSAISLFILLIVRLIVRIAGAIKQRRIDAKIEERALAKAAKRRGSFKKRQGSSENPVDAWNDDFVPPEESQLEIRKIIETEINEGKARNDAESAMNDTSSSTRTKADALFISFEDTGDELSPQSETNDLPDGVFYARPRPTSDASARKYLEYDVNTALKRLAELRDNGIMTEDEFEEKKAELLARIQ